MGYAFLTTNCAACGALVTCNPVKVPSITVNGSKQAICKGCFNRWNELHRTSKGLPPVALDPEAYTYCHESELAS